MKPMANGRNIKRLIIFIFFPLWSIAGKTECGSVKVGIFKLQSDLGLSYTITRTKTKQRENVAQTGLVSEFDIQWVSDCQYLLYNRKVIRGADLFAGSVDTIYTDILNVSKSGYEAVSTMKGFDMQIKSTLIRVDSITLYRNINDLAPFKQYGGASYGGALIDDNYSASYKQKTESKNEYLMAFEETYIMDNRSKFRLLDTATFSLREDQAIAISDCTYDGKPDPEVVAIYAPASGTGNVIDKAWRLNRASLRIEIIDIGRVKYKKDY